MNYSETLDYLYNKLPMFSRIGSAAFKKDLTNTRLLCEHLGNPQEDFKSIHVAGTNGKGSVSHMLAAIYQEAGYKTGLYTSPHLYDFRERIRIDGEMIEEAFVVDFVERSQPLIEKLEPSFFEITVAMAFEVFAKQKVDIAIIEVGLGGRLDSTNIIMPELSIITNIGWDHMNMLGNSLEEIAAEKAGIIKEDTPVVIGQTVAETRPVFHEIAKRCNAPVTYAEETFETKGYTIGQQSLEIRYKGRDGRELVIETDLSGIYQVQNVRTVLTAVGLLQAEGWNLTTNVVRSALKKVKRTTGLMGRWEVIRQLPTIVLEVAHNTDGIKQMLEHLQQLSYRRLHLIIGMVKDKDVDQILALLPGEASYYFTQANIPRALDACLLSEKGKNLGLSGDAFYDVNEALQKAMEISSEEDILLVCGSIFLVAEVNRTAFDN